MRLILKITALVDKDVAANSKPLSLIGVIIPFVPFMIFVDGPPTDTFPVLGEVAFAVSISWGLFVMWRVLRHMQAEFEVYEKALGSGRAWMILGGTLVALLVLSAFFLSLPD
ncbi:hypothetical protein [Sphingosinicella rhizophila]|uniref:Uncharacterized protein n=1 Tax=Sphingosinicella rhizophila TaxID=3050082 RepID=A0ABU3Q2N3_9SPHN|nr:hypothetical protein [Sphingosinicella sp. GR2756]MDT9597334.1 hypothetical protein [Sphingosinicella sp. GR2756]